MTCISLLDSAGILLRDGAQEEAIMLVLAEESASGAAVGALGSQSQRFIAAKRHLRLHRRDLGILQN